MFEMKKYKDRDYKKDPNYKNKGLKGKRCNRQSCTRKEAYWYNRVTMAYYCQSCANKINENCHDISNPILTLSEEDRKEWKEALKARYL